LVPTHVTVRWSVKWTASDDLLAVVGSMRVKVSLVVVNAKILAVRCPEKVGAAGRGLPLFVGAGTGGPQGCKAGGIDRSEIRAGQFGTWAGPPV
jgi:hypothetical protein